MSATWYKGDEVCTSDAKSSSEESGSLPTVYAKKKKGRGELNLCISSQTFFRLTDGTSLLHLMGFS